MGKPYTPDEVGTITAACLIGIEDHVIASLMGRSASAIAKRRSLLVLPPPAKPPDLPPPQS